MIEAPPPADEKDWWTPRRFLVLLSATVLAVFPKVALGVNTFFYRDFGALGYPGANFFRDSIQRGEFPLWNPYSHCGVPQLAQMGSWYLPYWVCAILPIPWAVNFVMLLHVVLGGWGMYSLARRWGAEGFAASFAGFAYAFNGVSLSCFQWGNYVASLALLPWVVITVTEAWRHGGRWLALAALTSALQVLTATPELTLMNWLLLGALWLGAVWRGEIKFWRATWRAALVILLAAGITMIQMLPFFDLLSHSQRGANHPTLVWAMPGWGWASLLSPLFHCYRSPQGGWFQPGQEFLLSYYLGAGVLALAVVGIGGTRWWRNLTLAAAALFFWIMALGQDGPLYLWVAKVFPQISVARFPIKFAIMTSFLIPLLAAAALQNFKTRPGRRDRLGLVITGATFLLLMGFLLWFARQYPFADDDWSETLKNTLGRAGLMVVLLVGVLRLNRAATNPRQRVLQFVLLGTVMLDLLSHAPNIVPTIPGFYLAPGMWQSQNKSPPPKLGEGRIMISPEAERKLNGTQLARMDYDFAIKRLAEWYNLNLLDMIPKVAGAITLQPAGFDRIETHLYRTAGATSGDGLLDFLSAAWISSPTNPATWIARTNFLPVMTAGQKPVFVGDAKALSAITAPDFDPRAVVYLPESEHAFVTVTNQTVCAVSNARFSLNQVEADVNAAAPSLVVLSQNYYHLWRAFVDEKSVPLLRANLAFQAVAIPAGTHHLKLVYRDPNLAIGAIISLLSLAACSLIWLRAPKIY